MILWPQADDLVYTSKGQEGVVKEVIGFIDANADGFPEWFYVRLTDDTEARVLADPRGPAAWTMDRRMGA